MALLVLGGSAQAQEQVNQFDENGARHGLWKKAVGQ